MKRVIIAVVLAIVCLHLVYALDHYTDKYDNIDLDEILKNDRLYKKYFECLTNRSKCTPDGQELKERMPNALKTNCTRCTEKQKEGVDKVLKFMLDEKPDDYKEVVALYDPDGIYRKMYKKDAEKVGLKID